MGAVTRQSRAAAKGDDMTQGEDREGGFLRAWSRRKIEAKRQEAEPEAPEEVTPPVEEAVALEAEVIDPDLVAALPSIDDITAGFDIKPFLAKGVPAHLKNAAMRRLWSVSPAVRDYVDPAMDYAWDWNAPGGVPGGGGKLSEKSVAKMVKDLIGNRPEPQDDVEPAESGAESADLLAEKLPDEAEVALPEAQSVRRSEQVGKASEKPEKREPARQTASTPAPPRRHGGAAPE
jgi:hypothetical protein